MMGLRSYLSKNCNSEYGTMDTVFGSWVQLSSTEVTNLTAPIKIYVQPDYAGSLKVSLGADASQIRWVEDGGMEIFDEVSSPHKLYIQSTVNDINYKFFWSYGYG